jgi:hypothetical protein
MSACRNWKLCPCFFIGIANAERGFMASQGKYASLNELISGNYITISGERPPYFYDVETTPNSFRATATRTTKGEGVLAMKSRHGSSKPASISRCKTR